jgi:hypothetical protein
MDPPNNEIALNEEALKVKLESLKDGLVKLYNALPSLNSTNWNNACFRHISSAASLQK